jgi:hypothetical protein
MTISIFKVNKMQLSLSQNVAFVNLTKRNDFVGDRVGWVDGMDVGVDIGWEEG